MAGCFILTSLPLVRDVQWHMCCLSGDDRAADYVPQYQITTTGNRTTTAVALLPRVACFLMVAQNDYELALSVRYSVWGRQCAKFVIVTNNNNNNSGDAADDGDATATAATTLKIMDDGTTIILDISTIIQQQLKRSNWKSSSKQKKNYDLLTEEEKKYVQFPTSREETKNTLALKAFYSWLAVADLFVHDDDNIDYVMKTDQDAYMLMDNYLAYLQRGKCCTNTKDRKEVCLR